MGARSSGVARSHSFDGQKSCIIDREMHELISCEEPEPGAGSGMLARRARAAACSALETLVVAFRALAAGRCLAALRPLTCA